MRVIKKKLFLVSAICLLACVTLMVDSCQVARYIFYNFADITDHQIFPSREIKNDSTRFVYPKTLTEKAPRFNLTEETNLDQFLEKNKTVAFLVIQNDSIQYERYFKGYEESSVIASFSMAKSVTSILIGCAIDDGLIRSVNDPVTDYIPELKKNGFDKITVKHVLQMTTGIKFNESYVNPFGDAATYYYGRDLHKAVSKMKPGAEPGQHFDYISGNTQVLGMILEKVLAPRSISSYLQEKIWKPMQMEYDATWSLDKKDGVEKTFCCLNARTRDFARIGQLFLNKGVWNGKRIISEKWVEESIKIETNEGSAWYYQYQWWLPTRTGDFFAQGILGQFIYVNPSKNLVIVRLGTNYGNVQWPDIFVEIANNLQDK